MNKYSTQFKKAGTHFTISLTATICKVLEKILATHIINITKDTWKDNQQFGFLPNRSTSDAIVQVIEDWHRSADSHETVQAIFFDFSKAFDLVDH